MSYEELLPYTITPQEQELLKAIIATGSQRAAAKALDRNYRNCTKSLKRIRDRAAKQGFSPDFDLNHPVPQGYNLKGASTLYDDQGNVKLQWIKSEADREKLLEIMQETVEAFKEEIPKTPKVTPPKKTDKNLLNLYPITDYHVGMLSWPDETGEDWNVDIAENLLKSWFLRAIESAPDAEIGVFANIGDFLHFDGLDSVTPESGHVLDADTRLRNIVRIAIRLVRFIIDLLLKKHKKVHVIMADANHDPSSEIWLSEWLSAHYENNPRISVDTNADTYYCYEFGKVSLFFHHGHKRKVNNIDDVFVAKYRDVFGRTEYSYAHMGHYHHIDMKETNLMIVEQHRTLAAKDAYASRGGWMAGRDAKVITYHREYGETGRITITPEMLK